MRPITAFVILCFVNLSVSASQCLAGLLVGSPVEGDEPVLHSSRYGSSAISVVSNGYLFVEGRYIASPYSVQRVGQAVLVNRLLVNALYEGDPDQTAKENADWRSPMYGFTPNTLKEIANYQMRALVRDLENRGAVFISAAEASRLSCARVPVAAKWRESDLQRALTIVASDKQDIDKFAKLKSLRLQGLTTDEQVRLFYDNARACSQLLNRVAAEALLRSLPR